MAWQKVSDTRWERPVNGLEAYFIFLARTSTSLFHDREHFTLYSKVKLETHSSDLIPALRHAWKQIRYEQPQIAVTHDGFKKVYEVPDTNALEEWLATTFIVSPASNIEEFYSAAKPIDQSMLYYLPATSEIVFRCPHYTVDGTGVLLFWHSYLTALESPTADLKFGDEPTRLAPTMEQILSTPGETADDLENMGAELFAKWTDCIPGVGAVPQASIPPLGSCRSTELVFPVHTTKALLAACKVKGVTISAAVHAAYIGAIFKYADPEAKPSQYVAANQFNVRPYLPEPYGSSKYCVNNYIASIPYFADLPASFWDLTKAMHEHYQTMIKGNSKTLDSNGHLRQTMYDRVLEPEFLAKLASKYAFVSSLGIAERYVQREYGSNIKVKELTIGVDVTLGKSALFIFSFEDQLRLAYSSNDGFETVEEIHTYLEEVKSVLIQELLG
ncbi:hypothetical protein F5B17DRAFT_376087 [Nemania serpens]|nr:hypothetical protein F5B17DRAFT_376087 [Nemania serpens]